MRITARRLEMLRAVSEGRVFQYRAVGAGGRTDYYMDSSVELLERVTSRVAELRGAGLVRRCLTGAAVNPERTWVFELTEEGRGAFDAAQ